MAQKTYLDAVREALREEMLRDENVLIMGEEVGVWGGTYAVTRGFYGEFGDRRILDTPIAEEVIVGAAVGAAMGGLRPVAEYTLPIGVADIKRPGRDVTIASLMKTTLSVDHRVADGAQAGRFMQEFKKLLENPANLLAD